MNKRSGRNSRNTMLTNNDSSDNADQLNPAPGLQPHLARRRSNKQKTDQQMGMRDIIRIKYTNVDTYEGQINGVQ